MNMARSDGTTTTRSQAWTLDALGNATTLTTNGTAVSSTFNKQNQITGDSYDDNGNDLSLDSGGAVYDAWNRLVNVPVSVDDETDMEHGMTYTYDALGRRIGEASYGGGVYDVSEDYHYSNRWQMIVEIGTVVDNTGSSTVTRQAVATYVWSPGYVDELVLRDRGATITTTEGEIGGPGTIVDDAPFVPQDIVDNATAGRVYAQQDANYNVTSLIGDTSSSSGFQPGVVERYAYDAYGEPTFLTASFGAISGNVSGYDFNVLNQGTMFDANADLYHIRNRVLSGERWIQQDPARYVNGLNVYQSLNSSPIGTADPSGLDPDIHTPPTDDDINNQHAQVTSIDSLGNRTFYYPGALRKVAPDYRLYWEESGDQQVVTDGDGHIAHVCVYPNGRNFYHQTANGDYEGRNYWMAKNTTRFYRFNRAKHQLTVELRIGDKVVGTVIIDNPTKRSDIPSDDQIIGKGATTLPTTSQSQ